MPKKRKERENEIDERRKTKKKEAEMVYFYIKSRKIPIEEMVLRRAGLGGGV